MIWFDWVVLLTVVLTVLVSLCQPKVFEASDFGSHPLFSVAQGGVDLQQVSMAAWGQGSKVTSSLPYFICQKVALTQVLNDMKISSHLLSVKFSIQPHTYSVLFW